MSEDNTSTQACQRMAYISMYTCLRVIHQHALDNNNNCNTCDKLALQLCIAL